MSRGLGLRAMANGLGLNPDNEHDVYLDELAKEMTQKCNYGAERFFTIEWLSTDLDYDIENCRKHCYLRNGYDSFLCKSCNDLLDEKIRKPFNKTKREIINDIIDIKRELSKIYEILGKLGKLET